jgi:hypothetical protein
MDLAEEDDMEALRSYATVLHQMTANRALTPKELAEVRFLYDATTERLAEVTGFKWRDPRLARC